MERNMAGCEFAGGVVECWHVQREGERERGRERERESCENIY